MKGKKTIQYKYDVVLSFANEEREFVEEVANFLSANGIKVFYDKYEDASLWGKDLFEYLADVYSSKARYCVVFISKHYKRKKWPKHERKSAQERALKDEKEYILPVRFDNTIVPGIRSTTGYLDARSLSAIDVASKIIDKINPLLDTPAHGVFYNNSLTMELLLDIEDDEEFDKEEYEWCYGLSSIGINIIISDLLKREMITRYGKKFLITSIGKNWLKDIGKWNAPSYKR